MTSRRMIQTDCPLRSGNDPASVRHSNTDSACTSALRLMWSLNGIFIWEISEIAMCGLFINLDNYSFAAMLGL
ncbi:hypothetical protein QQF64_034749 [Cirrhinus molitorella]|uniref:Uncharacterized protein n=1 Tax=Cirrhinus molitorella TaxID=172907 RepID=A0ABR3L540_9TELE